jgi:hypothetical protein
MRNPVDHHSLSRRGDMSLAKTFPFHHRHGSGTEFIRKRIPITRVSGDVDKFYFYSPEHY